MLPKNSVCLAILLCILRTCFSKLDFLCPLPEDAHPCWCDEKDSEITLYCSNLDESSEVYTGLHKLTNYKITKVVFWKALIDDLKPNVFQGLNIQSISFERSVIRYEPPQFLGLENSLTYLEIYRGFRGNYPMNKWSLSHLKNLKQFSIENNHILEIPNEWIQSSAPNLKLLSLDSNGIENLGDKVFAKLTSVTTIFLNDNKITELKRSMFPRPAENLRAINANDNNIKSLSVDMFDEMELQMIQLENNNLVTLDEKTWGKAIEKVGRIYLSDNPFVCDRSLKWLTTKEIPTRFRGECKNPENLRGKSLNNLTVNDFS